jgi:hypothetical protein
MTTTDKNRIIAEFMGLETGKQLGYDRWHQDWFDNKGVINGQRNTNLLFDSDWGWIMEVVIKIENLNENINVLFFPQGCSIDYNIPNGFSYSIDCNTKIESVYEAVFQFIQWYNQNKEIK